MEVDKQPDTVEVESTTENEWKINRKSSNKNKKHVKKYHECKECDFHCENETKLNKHTETHSIVQLNCNLCEEMFSSREDLKKH